MKILNNAFMKSSFRFLIAITPLPPEKKFRFAVQRLKDCKKEIQQNNQQKD
jgi:hypothetical protein